MEGNEWHDWRRQGIGSSDAPIIMGVSPWKTKFQLWEEKVGLVKKDDSGNWATRRGQELEPVARAHYELTSGVDVPIAFVQHKEFPFVRASLDGYNQELSLVLEIKCPGEEDHQKALDGTVPEKYYPQIQHQLLASGAKEVHYYSFRNGHGTTIAVKPDIEYIKKLLAAEIEFWSMVINKTAPELGADDFKKVDDQQLLDLIVDWKNIDLEIKALSQKQDLLRKQIIEGLPHDNVIAQNGVKIWKSYRAGSIDYRGVPALSGVDLEPFRKPGTSYYTFKYK